MADEEASHTDSRHSSSPATPNVSNPGTPRSELPPATPNISNPGTPRSELPPATPNISNPGTPRSELPPDVRATPPLPRATPPLARATPPLPQSQLPQHMAPPNVSVRSITQAPPAPSPLAQMHHHQSKYASLLTVIEDMGRDIRPTYAGNRSSTERLKRSIVHARILVRECLMECERSARS